MSILSQFTKHLLLSKKYLPKVTIVLELKKSDCVIYQGIDDIFNTSGVIFLIQCFSSSKTLQL